MDRLSVLGYGVNTSSKNDLLGYLEDGVGARQVIHGVTLNPEMLIRASRDAALQQAIQNAELCLPDGAGIVWALKRQGVHLSRIPGIEFADALLAVAQRYDWRVALIGAKPEVMNQTIIGLKLKYPNLHFAYTQHGYFENPDQVLDVCAQTCPQLVLLALGVPRQEILIYQWKERFAQNPNGCVLMGVGGSFDVWAGVVQRAPEIWQRMNLEWLYRVIGQPERWQRLASTLPEFVFRVLKEKRSLQTPVSSASPQE